MQASHANETHADAVDYDLIEPSKENIQPLRRGRDPKALVLALQPVVKATKTVPVVGDATSAPAPALNAGLSSGRTEASVKAERKKLEEAIKTYPADGPTPLQPWLAYISWTQQAYLTASLGSHLLPLLEKCTRTFLRDTRVNQTLKYLHVWVMYMDQVEDCLDMFAFLHTNGICTKHAALYQGWSQVFEAKGRVQDAQDTLQLGINFGAEPAAALRTAATRLEARIARNIAHKVAANPEQFIAGSSGGPALTSEQKVQAAAQRMADENGTTVRQPLQRISATSSSHREAMFERPVNGQTVYSFGAAAAAAKAKPAAQPTFSATASNFQIFCDDAAPSPAAAAAPFASVLGAAASSSSSSGGAQWREYAPASQIGKENRSIATKWTAPLHGAAPGAVGTTAAAEGMVLTLPVSIASDFPVFEDAECAAEEATKARERAAQKTREDDKLKPSTLRMDGPLKATNAEKGASATVAKLQANPLRNMKKYSAT